jgi:hypothetical protein
MANKTEKENDMQIDRISLETGETDSVVSLEDALNKLVPAYYMDRDAAAQTLKDGQPMRTTAFEYRKHKD